MLVRLRVDCYPSDDTNTFGDSTEMVEEWLPAVSLTKVGDSSNRVLERFQQLGIGRVGHIRLLCLGTNEDKLPLSDEGAVYAGCLVKRQPDCPRFASLPPTCSATGPPTSSLRLTNFFNAPVTKLSNSSTDCGSNGARAFAGSGV